MTHLPQTQADYGATLEEAYLRGLAAATNDAYKLGLEAASGRRTLPSCHNHDLKFHREKIIDFPAEDWDADIAETTVRAFGPCPGCGAALSTVRLKTDLEPGINCVTVVCNCDHDHGAGISRGCGRWVGVCIPEQALRGNGKGN